jgi:hypothetical protein
MLAAGITALATGIAPPGYEKMKPIQFAVLMEAHALYAHSKVAGAHPYRLEAQLKLIESMEEVRNGNRHWLHDPEARPPGERKPTQAAVRRQVWCVVAVELINQTGVSFKAAADEVLAALAGHMGAFTPRRDTILDWRRWLLEEPQKHPELAELYRRLRGKELGATVREKIDNLLLLLSSPDAV